MTGQSPVSAGLRGWLTCTTPLSLSCDGRQVIPLLLALHLFLRKLQGLNYGMENISLALVFSESKGEQQARASDSCNTRQPLKNA